MQHYNEVRNLCTTVSKTKEYEMLCMEGEKRHILACFHYRASGQPVKATE